MANTEISEADKKLLKAFHAMKLEPNVESPEDLMDYMRWVNSLKSLV